VIIYFLVLTPFLADHFEIGYGKPIDVATWQIREDPAKGIYDAVILEEVTQFNQSSIQHYRRLRILNENGKTAADFTDTTGRARDIKGRVVDANGQETPFNAKTDLVEMLGYKTRHDKSKVRFLVPPGLSNDCVVEMTWYLPADSGIMDDEYQARYYVPDVYYCRKKIFIIDKSATRSSPDALVSRFVWKQPPAQATIGFEEVKSKGDRILTYTDIPALENFPFGSVHLDNNALFVEVYKTFSTYGQKTDFFWKDVANDYLKTYLYSLKFLKPSDYKAWVAALAKGMPEDPIQAMQYLTLAFREKMANTDMLSPEQAARVTKVMDEGDKEHRLLSNAWKRGYGNSYELVMLFYNLLEDCDVPFQLAFTNSVYAAPFEPAAMEPFNLNYTLPFFVVESASGGQIPFSAHQYSYDPGFMPPRYQGNPALMVDPFDKWRHQFVTLNLYGPDSNKWITQYKTIITTEGQVEMGAFRQASGDFLASLRSEYFVISPAERDDSTRREWEDVIQPWEVVEATVSGADNLRDAVQEQVRLKGPLDVEDSAWFVFNPFPGHTYVPISQPNIWPRNRTQPIILSRACMMVDFNLITVPDGWRLRGDNNWKKTNDIGDVTFVAQQQGNEITVRRDVVVNRSRFPAEKEQDLKYFIAWVDEAQDQTIGLSRGGQQ